MLTGTEIEFAVMIINKMYSLKLGCSRDHSKVLKRTE